MNFIKILFLLFSSNIFATFNDMDCLNVNFKANVVHKGPPLGLTENVLQIQKSLCVLTIEHQKLKFFNKKWIIDVCREPVHIKAGTRDVEVLKRPSSCIGESKGHEFCTTMQDIFNLVQDDGLIFANGEKENLSSDHGKIYCSFLLMKKYLEEGFVLSRFSMYDNFIIKGLNPSYSKPTTGVDEYSAQNVTAPQIAPTPTPAADHVPEKFQQ